MSPGRVLLLRHGNTSKATVDDARQLTEKGRGQCLQFAQKWRCNLVGIKECMTPPTARTRDTAKLVTDIASSQLPELYFEPRSVEMKAADADLGYAPISLCLQKYPGLYDPWTEGAATAVKQGWRGTGDLLIVGHHTYISLLAMKLLEAKWVKATGEENWEKGRQLILDVNLAESSGFELNGSTCTVRYLQSPVETDFGAAPCNDVFTDTTLNS